VEQVLVEAVSFASPLVQALLGEWNEEIISTAPRFSPRRGSVVEATEFVPPDGEFVVATCGDEPIGCGGVRRLSGTIGELKRLYVRPAFRGQGTGRLLLATIEERAAALYFQTLRLDTDGRHPAALALFRSSGYQPVVDYNGNPYARHWFEKGL
jgi:GNAT superfamily N-acetyltransferase